MRRIITRPDLVSNPMSNEYFERTFAVLKSNRSFRVNGDRRLTVPRGSQGRRSSEYRHAPVGIVHDFVLTTRRVEAYRLLANARRTCGNPIGLRSTEKSFSPSADYVERGASVDRIADDERPRLRRAQQRG